MQQSVPPRPLLQKQLNVELKAIDEKNFSVTALASTEDIDRSQEIILQKGWELERFLSNPVFLYNHSSRSDNPQNVLGRVENLGLVTDGATQGLQGNFVYDADINEKAALVFKQVQRRTLRALSVGFIPLAWVTEYSPDDHINALPEFARTALLSGKVFVVYTRSELVEISKVPIPDNPQALVGASFKAMRMAELKTMEEYMSNKPTTPSDVPPVPAAVEAAAEMKEAPDLGAIVKSAVAEAVAPLVEVLSKLAASPVEKTTEANPAHEALAALAALDADQLDATLAEMTPEERKSLLALTSAN